MTLLHLNKTILLVPVPEGAHRFTISNATSWINWLEKPDEKGMCEISELIPIPPGTWSDPVLCKDVSEEEWRKIIFHSVGSYKRYEDFSDQEKECDTASFSAQSLLTREGMDFGSTLLLIKQD